MQQASQAHPAHPLLAQVKRRGDHLGIAAHGLGVQRRPAVPQVERLGQDEHRRDVFDLGRNFPRPADQRLGDLGAVDDRAIAAQALGQVHGLVSPPQELIVGLPMPRVGGHPQADRQRQPVVHQRLADQTAQPLGQDVGPGPVGVGEHQGELLSPDPPGAVNRALALHHQVAELPQRVIAHVVPEAANGGPIAAVVGHDNLIGTQFHPEKSQMAGLRLIANFLRWRP